MGKFALIKAKEFVLAGSDKIFLNLVSYSSKSYKFLALFYFETFNDI